METINDSGIKNILKFNKYLQRFTINNYLNDVMCEWFIFEKNLYSEDQVDNNNIDNCVNLDKIESIWDFCSLYLLNDLSNVIKDKYNLDNNNYNIDNTILLEIDAFATIDIKVLNENDSDFILSLCLDSNDTEFTLADGIIMNQDKGLLTIQTNKTHSKIHTKDKKSYMIIIFISM